MIHDFTDSMRRKIVENHPSHGRLVRQPPKPTEPHISMPLCVKWLFWGWVGATGWPVLGGRVGVVWGRVRD